MIAMVALYVMYGKVHQYCGEFPNENAAIRWFYKNRRNLKDGDGLDGEPVTVTIKNRRT